MPVYRLLTGGPAGSLGFRDFEVLLGIWGGFQGPSALTVPGPGRAGRAPQADTRLGGQSG